MVWSSQKIHKYGLRLCYSVFAVNTNNPRWADVALICRNCRQIGRLGICFAHVMWQTLHYFANDTFSEHIRYVRNTYLLAVKPQSMVLLAISMRGLVCFRA